MGKKNFETLRFISYTPPIWEDDPTTNRKFPTYPKEYIGLQANQSFWYHNGEKVTRCNIIQNINPITRVFEKMPQDLHPDLLAKYKEYKSRKKTIKSSTTKSLNSNKDIKLRPDEKELLRIFNSLDTVHREKLLEYSRCIQNNVMQKDED